MKCRQRVTAITVAKSVYLCMHNVNYVCVYVHFCVAETDRVDMWGRTWHVHEHQINDEYASQPNTEQA